MEKKEIKTRKIMFYECHDCGVIYMMFLEKGLEEYDGSLYKPVPFGLRCIKCGGFRCFHDLVNDIHFDFFVNISDNYNYFKNYDDKDCGIPIIKKPDFINFEEYYNFIALLRFRTVPDKLSFLIHKAESCSMELVSDSNYEISNRENRRHKSDKWKESRYRRRPDKKYF